MQMENLKNKPETKSKKQITDLISDKVKPI